MSERYEILEKIGQGGVGAVFKARDTQLKREVALKRLVPDGDVGEDEAEEFTENLLKEATTLSALQHPNIVTIFDVGSDEEGPFVVMELLRGETFDETIERGALPVEDFKNVVTQTLEAMIAAQALNVIHRDLKPGNLMVIWLPSGKFQIKILDFGLAKFGKQPSKQTADQGDGILGSIYFMAPEQFERIELDARTDMYALGCIYYYALTGQYPFRGENAPQVMAAHLQHHVQALDTVRPDLPGWLSAWVMWLISREMKDRPFDAKEAFEFFGREQSGHATTTRQLMDTGAVKLNIGQAAAAAPAIAVPKPARAPTRLIAPAATAAGGAAVAAAVGQPGPQPAAGTAAGVAPPSNPPPKSLADAFRPPAPVRKSGSGFPMWALFTVPLLAAIVIVVAMIKSKNREEKRDYYARLVELNEAESPEGDAETVSMLVNLVRQGGDNGIAALSMLMKLEGDEVEGAILKQLHKVNNEAKEGLIGVIVQRKIPGSITHIARYLDDRHPEEVREAAVYALGVLGTQSELTDLLIALRKTEDEATRRTLEGAIVALSSQLEEVDKRATRIRNELPNAEGSHRHSLLFILANLGGERAWRDLEAELDKNDGEATKAILRGISSWPDFTPGERLFALARDTKEAGIRLNAINAYLALLSKPSSMSAEEKVARLKELIPLANRTKDKQQILMVAAQFVDESALELARSMQDDKAVGRHAELAARQIQESLDKLITVDGEGVLPASDAIVLGQGGIQYSRGADAITDWDMQNTWVRWAVAFTESGRYAFSAEQATEEDGGSIYRLSVAGQNIKGEVQGTGANDSFKEVAIGEIDIVNPGNFILEITPTKLQDYELMNLKSIKVKKVGDVGGASGLDS